MAFRDRREAGRKLAERLRHLQKDAPIVVGLPRGGVPVAFEVARALDAPLDVLIVRKLGVPSHPELAMGAVGENGVRVLNPEVIRSAAVSATDLARVEARERSSVQERARLFRRGRGNLSLRGRTVIIVDDGLATGSTALAAIGVARALGAGRVVLAVPVAPRRTVEDLRDYADEVVSVELPEPFLAVGPYYTDFSPTADREVVELLDAADRGRIDEGSVEPRSLIDQEVLVGPQRLPGRLEIPAEPRGLVVFAHGSGSSRHSPRHQYVADVLHEAGIATLLFDLLTSQEERNRENVFDIPLLATRLAGATAALHTRPDLRALPLGYFGASTGAGAALWAAAEPGSPVRAVVSRGGRPDLAMPRLQAVRAPTLLIVGGRDDVVLELNRTAARSLRCEHRIEIVPGASHVFEEPGTLGVAAGLAVHWFERHFAAGSANRHMEAS